MTAPKTTYRFGTEAVKAYLERWICGRGTSVSRWGLEVEYIYEVNRNDLQDLALYPASDDSPDYYLPWVVEE